MSKWDVALANAMANPDAEVEIEDIPLGGKPAKSTWDKTVPDQFASRLGQTWSSKTEREAAYWLRIRFGDGAIIRYEPLMFRMPGGNYSPDFLVLEVYTDIPIVHLIEVKGSGEFRAYQSGRSSRKALKETAYHYAWMGRWRLLVKGKDGWELRKVK